jgi:hypothetical protein
MAWTCYSCGTKNPNSAAECQKCGGTVAAPRSFYIQWIFGGALFFVIFYLVGTFIGGILVEFAAAPSEADILAAAQAAGVKSKSVDTLEPEQLSKAKTAAINRAKEGMSGVVKGVLYWFLPGLLFLICGVIVGFVSDGRTVLEAAIGSVVGQVLGFVLMRFMFQHSIGWIALAACLVLGFFFAGAGAYLGEAIQEKRERAA